LVPRDRESYLNPELNIETSSNKDFNRELTFPELNLKNFKQTRSQQSGVPEVNLNKE